MVLELEHVFFVRKIKQSKERMALIMQANMQLQGLKQPAKLNYETEFVVVLSRGRAGQAALSVLLLQRVDCKSREKV